MKRMQKILAMILALSALVTALPASFAEESLPAQLEFLSTASESEPIPGAAPAEADSEAAPSHAAASEGAPAEPAAEPESPAEAPDEEPLPEAILPDTGAAGAKAEVPAAGPVPEAANEPPAEATPETSAEPTAEAAPELTAEPTAEAAPKPTAGPTAEAPAPEVSPAPMLEDVVGIPAEPETAAELPADSQAPELFPEEIFLLMGETYQLAAAQHPDYAGRLRYYQNDGYRRFLIDENGLITALDQGEERLSVYVDDNPLFSCKISVGHKELPPAPISAIVLPEKSITLHTADYREIWPQILPAGAVGTLKYSFSDPEIAEAEFDPLRVYGLRAGETTLTITADSGASASLKISVEYVEPYFRIDNNGVLIYAGDDNRTVEVPDGVTAIGPQAFRYHSRTKTVILPESCTQIDNEAFYASSIQQIILPDSLTSIGKKAFMDSRLQSLSLPAGIKTIGSQAFSGAPLQTVDLPEGLESIGGGAFAKTGITKLRLPGSLGVIDALPASDVEEIEFGEGISEVRCVAALGYNETNIRRVIFPSTIEYIYPYFFEQGIYSDQEIKIFGYRGSAAEEFCASHPDKSKFSFIPLDSIREDENFRIEGNVLAAYKGDASDVIVPEGVTVIGREAFAGKTHVASVTLPEGLTEIQASAFKSCTSLRKINLPESLQLIDENAFLSCSALQEINLPASLKTICNYAFQNCSSIREITIPGSIEFLGVNSFKGCTALESVVQQKGYFYIGGFADCTSLTSIVIPEGVKSIGDNAFNGCSSLKAIELPESLEYIGSRVFTGSALEEIEIPENVSTMSYGAFENCTTLRRVIMPRKLYRAYPQLFKGCSALTSVYIPSGIRQLNAEAFMNCTSLKSVYVPASVNEIEENVFLNCPKLTVITPSGSTASRYCKENGVPYTKPDAAASAISFPEGNLTLGVGQTYQLKCEADSDYALGTVSFSSSSSAVAVDKVTGELTAKKTGSATITAKAQSGAKASCKVTVKKAPSSVAFAEKEITMGYGERMQLSCILPKNTAAGLHFEGNNFFALHVEPDGWITAVGAGTDTVTVTTHNGATDSCTINVLEAPKQVILENTHLSIPQTLSHQLRPSVNEGSICRSFSYASSDPEIASVDENGLISAHAMGTAEITVAVSAAPEIFAVCSVTVADPPPRIRLAAEEITLGLKETFDLNPEYEGGFAGIFSCASSNSKIASVSAGGIITAKKVGAAVITVTGENGLSAECRVTVMKAPSSIKLSASALDMGVEERAQLSYTLSKNTAGGVSFESSDPNIVEVGADGVVTARVPGSATIQARTFNGKKAVVKISVHAAPESIAFERDGNPLRLGVGESGTLGVKFSEGSYGACRFASSHPDIVEIDAASGRYRAKMLGECSITVTTYNGISETRKVQVCMPPIKVEFDEFNTGIIGVGQQYRLSAFCPAENNQPCGPGLTFKSSNAKTAAVDVNGVVTGLKPGTVTITATSFNGKKDSWKMTVRKAPESLTLNAAELQLGYCETFPLEAILTPAGSWGNVQFSISDESAAWFDDEGLLLANRRQGSAVVTATTYNGLSASCTVHFGKEPGYVKFPQEEITLCVGMKMPLEFESDGFFSSCSIKTSDKKIAYVDNGMLIAKKKGSAEITVETYNMKRAVLKVQVEPAPKKHVLDLPTPLRVGERYNLLDYFSSTPSYDPLLLIRSISLSSKRALLTEEADGWYLTPLETGSITITVKTLNGSLRVKAIIVPGLDPDLPDTASPADASAVSGASIGT